MAWPPNNFLALADPIIITQTVSPGINGTPTEGNTSTRPIMGQRTPFPANVVQGPARPRAPSNPPPLPRPRSQINPQSFTLTPIPQGEALRGLAPPEEPRSLKDKINAAANIIGRPFTKAEVNWVMATLWPDSVDYFDKGKKNQGQAVRPPRLSG